MSTVDLHHAIEGLGPRVVLLHPVGLDSTFLEPLAHLLIERYSVMRIDLRGHGRSPVLPSAHSLEEFAEDVHALLVKRNFAPAAVVGFSFGGMVAQALALTHPEDIAALVPCACPSTLGPEARKIAAERAEQTEREGIQPSLEATLARWFTEEFRKQGGDAAARARLLSDNPRGWAQGWRAISKIDCLPRLGAVRVPTLCIAGERDTASPPAMLRAIADAIPGARYAELPGAPHMLFIEQPEAVGREILKFLDEVMVRH